MRLLRPAVIFAALAVCKTGPPWAWAGDAPIRIVVDADDADAESFAAPIAGATLRILPPVETPPRQDAPNDAPNNAPVIVVRPIEHDNSASEPVPGPAVVPAPAVEIAPQISPIGTPIDYNPFALEESPARQFDPGQGSIGSTGLEWVQPPGPSMDEQLWMNSPFLDGTIFVDHGVFLSAFQQPLQPLQPLQPVQPPTLEPFEPTTPGGSFDTLGTTSIAELAAAVSGGPAQSVGQAAATTIAPTDLGGLLQSASSIQSVSATRRSPVALDPNIRGYKFGQIFSQATGAYWFSVREDLDSMLSKIDPGMIDEVVVIPGPYGVRYGPGFSFIDIVTSPTPRYDCPQSEYRLNGNERANGAQLYGRATAAGGGDAYGYRVSYGHRLGSDYEAGNGLRIPSAYQNRDVWAQVGFDTVSPYQRVEASYLRLDQTDTMYAAQFFDVDYLGTNGTTLQAIDEDPTSPWTRFSLDGWWNHTSFFGSITPSKRRPDFPVIQRVEFALNEEIGGENTVNGTTVGNNVSSGYRSQVLWGDLEDAYFRTGSDFHYLTNRIIENYDVTNTIPPLSLGEFSTNLPRSRSRDNGFYAEYGTPLFDWWDVALGARYDYVETHADRRDIRPNTNLDTNHLTEIDSLYAYYVTNDIALDDAWTARVAYGYAQRPPNLTERYADGVFLGLLQSGFTRVIGDTTLKPERAFQLDAGLAADYDNFRFSGGWFFAWIIDYVTFEGDTVVEFFDARLVRYTNTPNATLTGFETAGEMDISANLTPFAKMKYVQGTDETIDGPLPAIPPLEATVGMRLHDSTRERIWEIEFGTRMVSAQDRLGEILILDEPTVIEERTPGFTTSYIRAFYNWSDDLTFIAGIDNVFNRTYQEHLDLRLLGPDGFPAPPTRVLSPGITPYVGFDWTF